MGKIIGIDLGTTNSCVAVMEGGKPVMILNAEGNRTTPSVVAFDKEGKRLIGQSAQRQAAVNSERTIFSIKREMGTDYQVKIDRTSFSPQEISAMILQKLKRDAEEYLGESVTEAVITVPAYFSDAQRQATKDAGRIAGLEVKRIINEPTAAALAYGVDKEEHKKVLVFDLGGGTFDVSILEMKDSVVEVVATAGNNRLGGDDFNQCIVDYLIGEIKKDHRFHVDREIAAVQRLNEAAEQAKIDLSFSQTTNINLPYLAEDRGEPIHLDVNLSRIQFNQLTDHLVQATKGPVEQALADAHIAASDIGKVLMVGGSSRIPAIQDMVQQLIGKEGFKGINPDECVAMGAAIQGGVLAGDVTGVLLLDVTPLSLGIETVGGMCTKVIERNTTIPIAKSQVFTTAANFQTNVEINVLQGERPKASQNKALGKFKLKGIQRAMRGVPQIEVTFSIDVNGIVNVAAKDLKTGKQQEITLTGSSNMSDADMETAIKDAENHAAEDEAFRRESEAQNRLEQLIYQAETQIKNLPKEEKTTKEELKQTVKEARKALRSKDNAEILAACTVIEEKLGC